MAEFNFNIRYCHRAFLFGQGVEIESVTLIIIRYSFWGVFLQNLSLRFIAIN